MALDNPLPNASTLAELIDYQTDAVVSRTLLKTPAASVTVFAFDAGQELSEHTAPFDALVEVLDGAVEIRISGVSHRVSAPEAILMPADEPHALKAVERFKMALTMIRPSG
jgi:quercetin dioxygenase-like cupin family protein